jgi:putative hydrolase of the HAD superfamily
VIRAALFDFGGVLTTSPFDAFSRYEAAHGLPSGFIRRLNATNHHDNAWAKLERSQIGFEEFCELFEAEAQAAGHRLDAHEVMNLLSGELRPAMIEAVRRCSAKLKTACLTNNFRSAMEARPEVAMVLELFDQVIASSEVGARKPDRHFYELACRVLSVQPTECVFLDDLGVNLKPAREMGMTTIKVTDEDTALSALEEAVGFSVHP